MNDKERHRKSENGKRFAQILGVQHFTQAAKKLNKSIVWHLADQLGKNICSCGKKVDIDNFTIGHILPWRRCFSRDGNAELFWDTANIRLEHCQCNVTHDNYRSSCVDEIKNWPKIHLCNENVKNKPLKVQLNFDYDLLNMEFGKANHRLFRKIMFEWCVQLGLNECTKCHKTINKIEEWTVEHIRPWHSANVDADKKALYFDLNNIGYSHLHCNCGSANLGKGKSGYNGVDWYVNKRTGYQNWRARLKVGNKHMALVHHDDPVICAENYDMGVLKYRNGEGVLNFPEKQAEYLKKIQEGWNEPLKCKVCGGKHFGLGYCRKHHYTLGGGKEKRREQYLKNEKKKLD